MQGLPSRREGNRTPAASSLSWRSAAMAWVTGRRRGPALADLLDQQRLDHAKGRDGHEPPRHRDRLQRPGALVPAAGGPGGQQHHQLPARRAAAPGHRDARPVPRHRPCPAAVPVQALSRGAGAQEHARAPLCVDAAQRRPPRRQGALAGGRPPGGRHGSRAAAGMHRHSGSAIAGHVRRGRPGRPPDGNTVARVSMVAVPHKTTRYFRVVGAIAAPGVNDPQGGAHHLKVVSTSTRFRARTRARAWDS
jgi:hypothetical protein